MAVSEAELRAAVEASLDDDFALGQVCDMREDMGLRWEDDARREDWPGAKFDVERGAVIGVCCTLEQWRVRGPRLAWLHPLRRVTLTCLVVDFTTKWRFWVPVNDGIWSWPEKCASDSSWDETRYHRHFVPHSIAGGPTSSPVRFATKEEAEAWLSRKAIEWARRAGRAAS